MTAIPTEHVIDAQKLVADGRVTLYVIETVLGGTLRIKSDNSVDWLGHTYDGLPVSLTGDKRSSAGEIRLPKLVIGQPDIDLTPFKGLVNEQVLEDARVTQYTVLLDNLLNNRDIKEVQYFRVKRVESYGRHEIILQLSVATSAIRRTIPHRQYLPPNFPFVNF